jgi:hypothetical protein
MASMKVLALLLEYEVGRPAEMAALVTGDRSDPRRAIPIPICGQQQ